MVAEFTLQAAPIAPSPLRVSVVLTANLFMLSETINYAIKCILTVCHISIWRQLLINGLICHVSEPYLVPEGTIARIPYFPTDITKFTTATVSY